MITNLKIDYDNDAIEGYTLNDEFALDVTYAYDGVECKASVWCNSNQAIDVDENDLDVALSYDNKDITIKGIADAEQVIMNAVDNVIHGIVSEFDEAILEGQADYDMKQGMITEYNNGLV